MMEATEIFFLFRHLVSVKGREFHNQLVKSWEWFHSELSARIRNFYEAVAARANGQDMMLYCSVGTSLFFTYTSLSSYTTWQWCTFTESQANVNVTIWRRTCVCYRYQHQFENCTYICKTCYSNGKEVVVTPKLTSSTDTSWFGLAKYAWSGYASFILCMLLWLGKW